MEIVMKTLKLSTGTFDQENTFMVSNPRNGLGIKASLHKDYDSTGDGIYWALQSSACVKSEYSDLDREETNRLSAEGVIQNGEIVMISGNKYKCRILGDYSDCAIFDEVI